MASPRIKAVRKIIGVVAQVSFPCGCNAVIARGNATTLAGTRTLVQHACAEWKSHKYRLADAERDLGNRMYKFRRRVL